MRPKASPATHPAVVYPRHAAAVIKTAARLPDAEHAILFVYVYENEKVSRLCVFRRPSA